jgi:signal transduction histidine kinase/ActR/RegA family two-component response regulator
VLIGAFHTAIVRRVDTTGAVPRPRGGRRALIKRPLRLAAITAFAALLIVAPVLVLATVTSRTLDVQFAEREQAERIETAQVAARILDDTVASAGIALRLLGTRLLVRESLEARDGPELARHLADVHAVSSLYGSAAAFAPDGRLLARDPAAGTSGQNFADRDFFRGALASLDPFVSEVYRSAVAPFGTVVAVAFSVRDGTRSLGVLQLELDSDAVFHPLEPIARHAGRTIVVVDDADHVIASNDPSRPPLIASGLAAKGGAGGATKAFRLELDGVDRFVISSALGSADWTVYLIDDAAVVLAVHNELARQRAAATGATAFIALLLGFLLATLYEKVAGQRDALRVAGKDLGTANAELARAGRHKSEFLASMSHELRTPLNAILGFSQLLQEQVASEVSERQRRYLVNITDAGTHLLALINDVLDLAKVEAGRIELRPERVTAHAAVDPTLSAARAAADTRGVRLDASVESASLDIDVGRLRQVLYNLLSNAVKFTPPGGHVGARVWTDGRDLHIEVADSGIGIPAERQSRVFGAFERVNEDRSESGGTGLGLALTRQLVEAQQGSITFESAEGAGTTFRVVLPGTVHASIAGERVLIVEDDPRDAELTLAITSAVGLRAELSATVGAAIEAARRSPPLAVLLDLRLAAERGETVLRELRACATTREIPIAIVSVEDDAQHIRALGADEHFTKPIDQKRLAEWLRRVAVAARAPAA